MDDSICNGVVHQQQKKEQNDFDGVRKPTARAIAALHPGTLTMNSLVQQQWIPSPNIPLLTPTIGLQYVNQAPSDLSMSQLLALSTANIPLVSRFPTQGFFGSALVPHSNVHSAVLSSDFNGAPLDSFQRKGLTGKSPVVLSVDSDESNISEYQCIARQNMEFFEATMEDIRSNCQGRNRAIVEGQVGIRCRHCSMLSPKQKTTGAVYYPTKLKGIYQSAQNMMKVHLLKSCQHVPGNIRKNLVVLREQASSSKSSAGGGKLYWAIGARSVGVDEESACLRFRNI